MNAKDVFDLIREIAKEPAPDGTPTDVRDYIDWAQECQARLKVAFEGGEDKPVPPDQYERHRYAPSGSSDSCRKCGAGERYYTHVTDGPRLDQSQTAMRAEAQADGAGEPVPPLSEYERVIGLRDKALADLAEAKKERDEAILEWKEALAQTQERSVELRAVLAGVRNALEAEKLKVSEARRENLKVVEGLQNQLAEARSMHVSASEAWNSCFKRDAEVWKILGATDRETTIDAARRVVKERDEARAELYERQAQRQRAEAERDEALKRVESVLELAESFRDQAAEMKALCESTMALVPPGGKFDSEVKKVLDSTGKTDR